MNIKEKKVRDQDKNSQDEIVSSQNPEEQLIKKTDRNDGEDTPIV